MIKSLLEFRHWLTNHFAEEPEIVFRFKDQATAERVQLAIAQECMVELKSKSKPEFSNIVSLMGFTVRFETALKG